MPSTTFFNTLGDPLFGAATGITCPCYGSFSVPAGNWLLNFLQINCHFVGGATWKLNVDLFAGNGANIGANLGNLCTSFIINASGFQNVVVPVTFATPIQIAGGARYYLRFTDPLNTGVNINTDSNGGPNTEYTSYCNNVTATINSNTNQAFTMQIGGDPVAGVNPLIDTSKLRMIHLPTSCCERELCLPMASSKEFIHRA